VDAVSAPQLTTEALELRRCAAEDLEVLIHLWTDPAVRRFLFDDREISREEAQGFLTRSEDCFREEGYGLWLFFERGQASLGGFAGILRAPLGEANLMFGTRPDLWGRGYAFQAASAVVAYAFETLGLARVVADVDEPNSGSIRVLEKLGMRRTGRRIVNEHPLLDYELLNFRPRPLRG
jgi:RimJ/RimL family protein N-acetyltransferase